MFDRFGQIGVDTGVLYSILSQEVDALLGGITRIASAGIDDDIMAFVEPSVYCLARLGVEFVDGREATEADGQRVVKIYG